MRACIRLGEEKPIVPTHARDLFKILLSTAYCKLTGNDDGVVNVSSCTRIALTTRRRDNAISSALIALPLAENDTSADTSPREDGNIIFSIFLGLVDIPYLSHFRRRHHDTIKNDGLSLPLPSAGEI